MTAIDRLKVELGHKPLRWLVTGSAGFIGSHLIEALLHLNQNVKSIDNFATGHRRNLDEVRDAVSAAQWRLHQFCEADIRDPSDCRDACHGIDVVLHQAALGSVPRSLADPFATNAVNVDGFLNMLVAARDAAVGRFVYAASSSVYGDDVHVPKVEDRIGRPLSPYAATKLVNEIYAEVFSRCYGMTTVGLRYFNVFGPRQDPEGAYAAVVPRWIAAMIKRESVAIHGDGETSRDFCYVQNAVQANLLAAKADLAESPYQVFNVALDDRTTLNELFLNVREELAQHVPEVASILPVHREFRAGDVRHSQADISKARRVLGYAPTHRLADGLRDAMPWYVSHLAATPVPGSGSMTIR